MRLLLLSIEFRAATFSGNGVYSQAQCRALARAGHTLLVISGRPQGAQVAPPWQDDAITVLEVELPVWGRLDFGCSWREYAAGAAHCDVAGAALAFRPDAVLGVDWHSLEPYQALRGVFSAAGEPLPPYVYMNYRIYSRTAAEGEERDFVAGAEGGALAAAAAAVVLSRSDAQFMRDSLGANAGGAATETPIHVLLPALRRDMEALPVACPAATERRRYLSCCVRLSPEKEPLRFVELAAALRPTLQRLGLTPVVCGAGWDSECGAAVQAALAASLPEAERRQAFMGPAELAELYSHTALNIHPPDYDAYGMTIVEAAAQGAPSLVGGGGHVGATDLLSEAGGEVVCMDLSRPVADLAAEVEALLCDAGRLAAVGAAAQAKARGWTEDANAAVLVGFLRSALEGGSG